MTVFKSTATTQLLVRREKKASRKIKKNTSDTRKKSIKKALSGKIKH